MVSVKSSTMRCGATPKPALVAPLEALNPIRCNVQRFNATVGYVVTKKDSKKPTHSISRDARSVRPFEYTNQWGLWPSGYRQCEMRSTIDGLNVEDINILIFIGFHTTAWPAVLRMDWNPLESGLLSLPLLPPAIPAPTKQNQPPPRPKKLSSLPVVRRKDDVRGKTIKSKLGKNVP